MPQTWLIAAEVASDGLSRGVRLTLGPVVSGPHERPFTEPAGKSRRAVALQNMDGFGAGVGFLDTLDWRRGMLTA
ncbi:MAG: hypothetical protein ACI8Y4_000701 [Candidatus Poriferisodalaceae bacterium]